MRKHNVRVDSWRIRNGQLATPGEGMIGNFYIPVGGIGNKSRLLVRARTSDNWNDVIHDINIPDNMLSQVVSWEVVLVNTVNGDRQPFGEALDSIAIIWFEDGEEVIRFHPTVHKGKLGVVTLCHPFWVSL